LRFALLVALAGAIRFHDHDQQVPSKALRVETQHESRFQHTLSKIWEDVSHALTPFGFGESHKFNHVEVLAYGDSLTHGFGRRPYPQQLEEMLNKHGDGRTVYHVANAGVPGELTSSMVGRLPATIEQLKSAGRKPKYVLILGGTNDLLWGNVPAEDIVANLRSMKAAVLHEDAIPVFLKIPRLDLEADDQYHTLAAIKAKATTIQAVNKALDSDAKSDKVQLADISQVSRDLLVDGVHFSGDGYERIAKIVFDTMTPMLA